MESSTFEQVVEDEDVVLELEAISIAEDADSSGSMAYGPCPRVVDTGFVVRRLRAA